MKMVNYTYKDPYFVMQKEVQYEIFDESHTCWDMMAYIVHVFGYDEANDTLDVFRELKQQGKLK